MFGYLEHTNNCYIFSISGQNDWNETKLTCNRGFRRIAGSTSNDSIRRSGVTADLDPTGPNPLADMDPPSQIWTPLPNFPFKHPLYHIW